MLGKHTYFCHVSTDARVTNLPFRRCRQSQTVEALGWIEFSLCILTLITTILWMTTGVRVRMKDSRTFV